MKSSEAKRRQVRGLFRVQKGLCYWCKVLMVIFDQARVARDRYGRPKLPPNLATIDHLDDRFSTDRGKHPGEKRRVLACKRCNELRGKMSQAMQPIEVLRARSQRHGVQPDEQRE